MTTSDMKRLSRADLLEMLIDQSMEVQELRKKLQEMENVLQEKEAMLQCREMKINQAGSIAEASLQLSGIFEAAEAACQRYTENICQLSERQQEVCRKQEQESREKADQYLKETEKKCLEMKIQTKLFCEGMIEDAQRESQHYWDEIVRYLETYHEGDEELQELFTAVQMKQAWR